VGARRRPASACGRHGRCRSCIARSRTRG
jgi:hypothetical protein